MKDEYVEMSLEIDSAIQNVINVIPNPVILTTGKEVQSANTPFLDFFGVNSVEEFNSRFQCVADLFVSNNGFFTMDEIETKQTWSDYLWEKPERQRVVSLFNRNGDLQDFEITLKKIEFQPEYLIVFNNITSFIHEKNEYEFFAYHDHLTKIYNRQKFDELFLKAIENKKRYGDHLSVILIDIDYFKKVNDTYGHLVGDLVLVMLVTIVSEKLRINDIFARWGGEEFIILLPRTDRYGAFAKGVELHDLVQSYSDKQLPPITISLGVTELLPNDTMHSCLKRVDDALFKAKEKRNNVVVM